MTDGPSYTPEQRAAAAYAAGALRAAALMLKRVAAGTPLEETARQIFFHQDQLIEIAGIRLAPDAENIGR
jgi:hypothetical protein